MEAVILTFIENCRLVWLGLLYPWIWYQYAAQNVDT